MAPPVTAPPRLPLQRGILDRRTMWLYQPLPQPPGPVAPLVAPLSSTQLLYVQRGMRKPVAMRRYQPVAQNYLVDVQSGTLVFGGSSLEYLTPPTPPSPRSNVTQLAVNRGVRNVVAMRRYRPVTLTYLVDAQAGTLIFSGSSTEYLTPPTPGPPRSNVTQLAVSRGVRNVVAMRRYQPLAQTYRVDAQTGVLIFGGSRSESATYSQTATGNLIFGGSGVDVYLPPGSATAGLPGASLAVFIRVS